MTAGRARLVLAAGLAVAWLLPLSAAPAAAATCALSAPATVQVGTSFAILGSGFPVSSSVDVSIELQGTSPDEFTVQSDGSGAFRVDLTPEAVDVGTTTVTASAGTACSAQATYVVSADTPAPSPSAVRPPSASGGGTSGPPRTDSAPARGGREPGTNAGIVALAIVLVTIGLAGLVGTRRAVRP